MKLNALSRGVPLSSLVLAAFAVAGCGDKDAAETPAAPKAASTAAPAVAAPHTFEQSPLSS